MPGKSGQFALTETDSDGYPLIGNTNRALRECDQKKGDSLVFEHFHAALSPTEAGLPTKKQGRLQRMEFCLQTRVGEYHVGQAGQNFFDVGHLCVASPQEHGAAGGATAEGRRLRRDPRSQWDLGYGPEHRAAPPLFPYHVFHVFFIFQANTIH
jgi:hypothetical protein